MEILTLGTNQFFRHDVVQTAFMFRIPICLSLSSSAFPVPAVWCLSKPFYNSKNREINLSQASSAFGLRHRHWRKVIKWRSEWTWDFPIIHLAVNRKSKFLASIFASTIQQAYLRTESDGIGKKTLETFREAHQSHKSHTSSALTFT